MEKYMAVVAVSNLPAYFHSEDKEGIKKVVYVAISSLNLFEATSKNTIFSFSSDHSEGEPIFVDVKIVSIRMLETQRYDMGDKIRNALITFFQEKREVAVGVLACNPYVSFCLAPRD